MMSNPTYAKVGSRWRRRLVSHKLGALVVHWLFQGMLQMGLAERGFKLGLDALAALVAGGILWLWLPILPALGLGVLVAHTLNFVLNGQIYGLLKHFGGVEHSWETFYHEVEGLRARVAREPAIRQAVLFGSLSRDAWRPTSDLDVRLVRAPGLHNAWRACWFAARERARACWEGFPLDLLVLDDPTPLEAMAEKGLPLTDVALCSPLRGFEHQP
jgi:hypothetical protein